METNIIQTLALTLGASWAAGINLYAAVLTLGLMQRYGAISLPSTLEVVANPIVMVIAGVMFFVEFFADKIPGLDSAWDALHTFIRIPAGAVLAAQAIGPVDPGWQLAAALAGGTLAGASHVTKAGTRVLINTSPEPVSNWTASFVEDIAVIGGLWVALHHPIIFLILLVIFIALVVWLLPKLLRAIWKIFSFIWGKMRRLFGAAEQGSPGG
jgi:hypothetical protein